MSGTRYRARPALPGLPKGAEREIIAQFRAIEHALDEVQGIERNATPVLNVLSYQAKAGELVLLEGRAGGTLVTIPPGSSFNIEQTIRVALVGGVLSPGVTISIVGRVGTIDGAATFTLASRMLVELTSVGERGWAVTCCGGSGGLTPPVALTDLQNIADETFVGNVSGAPAPPAAVNLSSLAGTGLVWNSGTKALDVSGGGGFTLPQIRRLLALRAGP